MTLWLVRHARPLMAPGVCYGALDVAADAPATFNAAYALARALPPGLQLRCSPLQRCEQLTTTLRGLRPDLLIKVDKRLAEMDFGTWEGRRWDTIDRAELDGWTANFRHWRCGGAECVQDVMTRVAGAWDDALATGQPTAWITHAGVIRAVSLIAQGQRVIDRADQWPVDAPAWGAWRVLTV